jgi:hypothetical protein
LWIHKRVEEDNWHSREPPQVDDGSCIRIDFPPSNSKAPKNGPLVECYDSDR